MRPVAVTAAGVALILLALSGCQYDDVGYVEIRTVPVSAVPSLYLGATKLAPLKNGVAVLRQQVGTTRLQMEVGAGQAMYLCDVNVKRNRITNVTISILERPPRCQCRNPSTDAARTCLS